jgi:hypothetical protein
MIWIHPGDERRAGMPRWNKAQGVNVVRHDDGWAVWRDGARRASKVFDTQQEAIAYGRPTARREQTELRIQHRQGRWRDSYSYGGDPAPPIDEKH